jgi:hypothetical protein
MEAKELRLNNLFIDSKTNTVISVIGLTEEIITFSGHFKNDWQAEPIPLTEEWLLKFGFEKIIHIHGYTFFVLKSTKKTRHASISIYKTYTTVGMSSCVHCENVHQLQNLYFALTNRELKLT